MKKLKVLFVVSVLSVAAMAFPVPEAKACSRILITNDCGNPPCEIEVLTLCGEDAEYCYYC